MYKIIICLLLLLPLTAAGLSPVRVMAYNPFPTCPANENGSGSSAVCQDAGKGGTDPLTGPNGEIRKIGDVIALLAGAASVVVIILAGFSYITSAGDTGKAKSARNAIIYALLGLVVISLADAILSFVLSRLG